MSLYHSSITSHPIAHRNTIMETLHSSRAVPKTTLLGELFDSVDLLVVNVVACSFASLVVLLAIVETTLGARFGPSEERVDAERSAVSFSNATGLNQSFFSR